MTARDAFVPRGVGMVVMDVDPCDGQVKVLRYLMAYEAAGVINLEGIACDLYQP
jgi:hypothetical protein